jgi:uncharacterized protein YcbX
MDKRRISEIWIYPIKSLAGIRLRKAIVEQKGLQYDRRWMLVDTTGRFLTQREHPEMALFNVMMDNSDLIVSRQSESIRLDVNRKPQSNLSKVQIWERLVFQASWH